MVFLPPFPLSLSSDVKVYDLLALTVKTHQFFLQCSLKVPCGGSSVVGAWNVHFSRLQGASFALQLDNCCSRLSLLAVETCLFMEAVCPGFWSLTIPFFFPEPDLDTVIPLLFPYAFFLPLPPTPLGLRTSCQPDTSLLSLEPLPRIPVKGERRVLPEEMYLLQRTGFSRGRQSFLRFITCCLSQCLV